MARGAAWGAIRTLDPHEVDFVQGEPHVKD
jgi:hypothetical protein